MLHARDDEPDDGGHVKILNVLEALPHARLADAAARAHADARAVLSYELGCEGPTRSVAEATT